MNPKVWIVCGAVLGGIAVAAGALGAHSLEGRLDAAKLRSFETAARYQMFHALAIVLCGLLASIRPSTLVYAAAAAFLIGTLAFSGGLYAWIFTGQRALVHVVPVGGLVWIVAWLLLALAAWRS